MSDRLEVLLAAKTAHSEIIAALVQSRGSNHIAATGEEWDALTSAGDAEKAARAALMPTEQDAIRLMFECWQRLKELGWNDAIYCRKDGSEFDAIEPGSAGIHKTHYSGEWPEGGWWIADAGDLWPSRPILYRPTEAELAKREELRRRFCEERDGPLDVADGAAG